MAKTPKSVETITHENDVRTNIPTAEYENMMHDEDKKPIELKYPRNSDLDPQLVWRGKDDQDWSDLVVTAPPLYIQEKINPKHFEAVQFLWLIPRFTHRTVEKFN